MNREYFLGVYFDQYDLNGIVNLISQSPDRAKYIVTPNVNIVCKAKEDSSYKALIQKADVVINDSRVLQGLARLFGASLTLVPGSDLVEHLIKAGFFKNKSAIIVGSDADSIAKLNSMYDLNLEGCHPPMGLMNNNKELERTIEYLSRKNYDFILLALGVPLQEIIASKLTRVEISKAWILCIGASVDFLVDTQKRAPVFFRRLALEWAFRMFSSRRLMKRYLADFKNLFLLIFLDWKNRPKI